MNCPGCGREIPDGSMFCSGCGRKVEVIPVNTEAENNQQEAAELDRKLANLRSEKINLKAKLDKRSQDPSGSLKKKERMLQADVSQLKLVKRQREQTLPYQMETGERYLLALQPKAQKTSTSTAGRATTNETVWLYICIALNVVAIIAFFMSWVKSEFISFKLIQLARISEKPFYLLAYIVPILYAVQIFMLWQNKNFEDTDTFIKISFIADLVVVVITFIACLSASGSSDNYLDEIAGPGVGGGVWLALIAGIASYAVARYGAGLEDQGKQESRPSLLPKAEQFHVPVVNYNALLECRPLKVTVDGDGNLFVEFRCYEELPTLLQLDIDLIDRVHDVYTLKNLKFSQFKEFGNHIYRGAVENQVYQGPTEFVYAKIYMKQYSFGNGMAEKTVPLYVESELSLDRLESMRKRMNDTFHEPVETEQGWRCTCGTENTEDVCVLCERKKDVLLNLFRQ